MDGGDAGVRASGVPRLARGARQAAGGAPLSRDATPVAPCEGGAVGYLEETPAR
jgi:hypothetical protein